MTINNWILPNLLVLPMILHWLLPSGMEQFFYIDVCDLVFFLPDFFYLFYVLFYLNKKEKLGCPAPLLKLVCASLFLYSTLLLFYNLGFSGIFDIVNIVLNNYCFVYYPLIFFCFPLNRDEMEKTKILIIPAAIIISLEIILYSTGVLTYTSDTGDSLTNNLYKAGDVFRVSTTVGAATGTSIILFILGIITTSFYKMEQPKRVILLLLFTIGIFLTMSRGAIISWCIYLFLFIYIFFLRNKTFLIRTGTMLALVLMFSTLNIIGLFDPILERNEKLENVGLDSGRNERFANALEVFQSSYALGVGSGQVFPDKSIANKIVILHKNAPHNTFLIYLAELGLVGLCLILIEFVLLCKNIDYRSIMGLMIFPIFLINMNIEGVFISQEYFSLLMFYILLTPQKKKEIIYA